MIIEYMISATKKITLVFSQIVLVVGSLYKI